MTFHTSQHGLDQITCEMFKHLGWMVLAKEHNQEYKISCYKKSLKDLKKSLEERLKITESVDNATDLKELHSNVTILLDFVHKTL
jgi:hypothetical protein